MITKKILYSVSLLTLSLCLASCNFFMDDSQDNSQREELEETEEKDTNEEMTEEAEENQAQDGAEAGTETEMEASPSVADSPQFTAVTHSQCHCLHAPISGPEQYYLDADGKKMVVSSGDMSEIRETCIKALHENAFPTECKTVTEHVKNN